MYNGGSDSSPTLKDKLCGTSRPSNTESSGNQLFLKFHTDGDASKTGFKIAYNLKCEYHCVSKKRLGRDRIYKIEINIAICYLLFLPPVFVPRPRLGNMVKGGRASLGELNGPNSRVFPGD